MGVVREHGGAHLGHGVQVGAVHDDDVDGLIAVGGLGHDLLEPGEGLQERVLIRPGSGIIDTINTVAATTG